MCPYHGMCIKGRYPTVVSQGMAWVDVGDEASARCPPTLPEFESTEYRTFDYSTHVRGVNPVLFMENLLDWNHLLYVHLVHFTTTSPQVTVHPAEDGHGRATYQYAEHFAVDSEYWAPFTACLRFRITSDDEPDRAAPLLLWFSILPHSMDDFLLNLRVARTFMTTPLLAPLGDGLCRLANDLPLWEDARVVAGTNAGLWNENRLGPADEHLARWRAVMRADHPDMLRSLLP